MSSSTHVWQSIDRPQEGASITFDYTLHMQRQIDGEESTLSMQESGFAICIEQKIYAYRNHCPHIGSPLDWIPNQFFSDDGKHLVCHTHGAQFDPRNGNCLSGPCPRGLYPLDVQVYDDHICVPAEYTIKR